MSDSATPNLPSRNFEKTSDQTAPSAEKPLTK
jgi:hypothetical protein